MLRKIICGSQYLEQHCGGLDDEFWMQLNAFVAGAVSVSFLIFCKRFWEALQLVPDNLHNIAAINNDGENDVDDDESWIDPWNAPLHATNRLMASLNIGELPIPFKRRQHWPWETIRHRFAATPMEESNHTKGDLKEGSRRNTNSSSDSNMPVDRVEVRNEPSLHTAIADIDDLSMGSVMEDRKEELSTASSDDDTNQQTAKTNSALCIGSIFGMDVGGTLAKLVYFEQKQQDFDPLQASLRERHYAKAASAQAVVMAQLEKEKKHPISSPRISESIDDSIPTGNSSAATHTQYMMRRRSFSIGLIGSAKKKQEKQKEMERESKCKPKDHQSEQDLKQLYATRQESLPDDVRKFRHSVDFHTLEEDAYKEIFDAIGSATLDNGDCCCEAKEALTASSSSMGRSKSMFNMSNLMQQKEEALDRFYNFARRLGDQDEAIRDHQLSFYCRELGGEFHFISFETRRMKNAMDLIRYNNLHLNIHEMGATGGGAHKFADVWEKELGIRIDKQDELDSLLAGMQFVLSTVIGECYTFRPKCDAPERQVSSKTSNSFTKPQTDESDRSDIGLSLNESTESSEGQGGNESNGNGDESTPSTSTKTNVDEWWWSRKVQRDAISYSSSSYPYLLVTIGTGVSFLRVDGPRKYERISGSTIGGGTYWGLMRLLTDVESFDNAMKLAEVGDPSKVDMMVGDIYGTNSDALEKLGLPANIVASSFGKLVAKEEPAEGLTQEDLARALLLLVTNNIGQVAHLNAKLSNTRRIYFVGSFLRHNTISQRRLSYAIDFWSKGEMEALFLQHEGYFGALGAFLKSQKIEKKEEGCFQWEDSPHRSSWHSRSPKM